jgi:hypothetical protein
MCNTYSGWTNYETWAVKLWLDNEESTYKECVELSQNSANVYELSQQLEAYVDEYIVCDAPSSGLTADLFLSAFQNVNWREIAEAYREDYPPSEDEDQADEEDKNAYAPDCEQH